LLIITENPKNFHKKEASPYILGQSPSLQVRLSILIMRWSEQILFRFPDHGEMLDIIMAVQGRIVMRNDFFRRQCL